MLVNVSPNYLYWKDLLQPIREKHRPYFLAFAPAGMDVEEGRKKVADALGDDERVEEIGGVERYQSFWDQRVSREVFRVYTAKSYLVPEVSDDVFHLGLYTAEHDVPYHERALVDLAAAGDWVFDTRGGEQKMTVTAYDIEMTQYGQVREVPIDIIGYYQFDFSFRAQKDLDSEDFSFQFIDFPERVEGEVQQMVAHSVEEEIEMLLKMCDVLQNSDIITGHNIIGFDNLQIYERIQSILKNAATLSDREAQRLRVFLDTYARRDQSYHFGTPQTTAIFYPASFDTLQAARKFYTLDSYSLSSTAEFLGVGIPDRLDLDPEDLALDERTFQYNREDVREQAAIAIYLLQQALPLAFTTGMPFELLLPSGATKMWDFMAMIRAAKHRKIMPATCRALDVASAVGTMGATKQEIAPGGEEQRRKGGAAGGQIRRGDAGLGGVSLPPLRPAHQGHRLSFPRGDDHQAGPGCRFPFRPLVPRGGGGRGGHVSHHFEGGERRGGHRAAGPKRRGAGRLGVAEKGAGPLPAAGPADPGGHR